ncbi:seryl-tRNA synthetase [Gloeomargarita lithophora Alchichica-D10]|uniref:Serine--tRNA ligase n=1 Tax=Gloeomargarita lithophora Alchichica-D10 TaxID=1188229 RepID=A0A1J0AD41_9CYAN|nr:serine--tRNA ligase [Gloeomargarita lithophora]APB33852.1 seryl-tRNA synthetase [Gloeomargarita lithophora Alchichica-D10]
MLDLKLLREQPAQVREQLATRQQPIDLQPLLTLDEQVRLREKQRSQLQAESNDIGKQVGQLMRAGAEATPLTNLRHRGQAIKQTLASLEQEERELRQKLQEWLLQLPNLPALDVPVGADENDNIECSRWGDEYKSKIDILPHWEVAEKLHLFETERSTKIAQSRFITLWGAGAALERALIQWMLNWHTQRGYIEVLPPFLVNSQSLTGTGQLPKFSQESFACREDDLWLIPTAEVPVTNLYRDEILSVEQLPIYHCAWTPCFRREAGSYGRDTRGLIRLHQFNKVELVKIIHPETSAQEHEQLVQDATSLLEALKLPYRVMELCTGDLGFAAQKCFDLEVWLPAQKTYREISSCSNFGDFQARRAGIRYREPGKKGTEFVHTLNGSALAVGRTMAAILEQYQQADGRVHIPEVLQPILGREIL